jgi:hypothetical protein
MAPLLRLSIRNRKIDDDDDENGNGKNDERNGTSKHNKGNSKNKSKNKNRKNVPPLAAAATETKKKTSPPSHLPAKKKKKLKVTTPQPAAAAELLPLLAVVSHHHPYMELNYPKRIPTIQQIQRMEESVLLKLIDRSKWRSYPSGPQQCYEKSLTNTNTNANPTGDGDGDVVVDGSRSSSRSISSRRITHLKIIDNTFYERLQLILAFRNAAAANRNANNRNNRNHDHHDHLLQLQLPPRILGPRPMWRMTKDIAILDQLQIMELYRCTGRLPKSMKMPRHFTYRMQLEECICTLYDI